MAGGTLYSGKQIHSFGSGNGSHLTLDLTYTGYRLSSGTSNTMHYDFTGKIYITKDGSGTSNYGFGTRVLLYFNGDWQNAFYDTKFTTTLNYSSSYDPPQRSTWDISASGTYDITSGTTPLTVEVVDSQGSSSRVNFAGYPTLAIDPVVSKPSYNSISASNISGTSVKLTASINNGGATISSGGWKLSSNGGTTWTDYSGDWTSKTITGLSNNTTYTYKGYATNTVGTTESSSSTFTTLGPPTYDSTPYTSNLTHNSVQLNVATINNHGSAITGGGWMLSTNSGSTWTDYPAAGTSSDSCWKKTIYNLSPVTTYQYKGYATNGVGTSYSSVGSFTTKAAPPTLASPSITNITATSAYMSITCTNTGGKPLTSSNIKVYTTNSSTLVATINGLSGTATGLSPNTEYRVEANASNADNSTSYGMGTFTTSAQSSNVKVSLNGTSFVVGTVKVSLNGGGFVTIPGSKIKTSINGGSFQ